MLTVKNIITDTNELIREKSQEVPLPLSFEDEKLAQQLLEYVLQSTKEATEEESEFKPAVGIAAIQVGIAKKIMAIAYSEEIEEEETIEHRYLLANAKIIRHSVRTSYLSSGEGCLSVEDIHEGYVVRARTIQVKAYDILRKTETIIDAEGYLAIVLQHEIDHFQGILYYDHINTEDPYSLPVNCEAI